MIPGYRIIRELGRGGMATVYLAEQESLGREVALKVLAPHMARDEAFAARFLREMRIAGAFRHPNIVPVHDAGQTSDGTLYIAMEYVPGGTAAMLRGGDTRPILRLMRDVASALGYAHQRGVVHRDLKPENILRREDGSFVLSDFGIARSGDADTQLTGPNSALGTPSYMSPEQWRGEALDGRADLYALGIVFFDLLTGRVPYSGTDGWAIGMQHLNAPRPQLPADLARWQPLLNRLVAVNPGDRCDNANALLQLLQPEALTPAPVTTPIPLASITPLRNRRVIWIAAAIMVVLSTVATWQLLKPRAQAVPTADTAAPTLRDKSIAVLPFRSLSDDKADAYFSAGLSEEILNSLSNIHELKVVGRGSAFSFNGDDIDVREVGRRLDVAHVLEGSVRRQGEAVRVNARLSDAVNGFQLWNKSFERSSSDLLDLQGDIARDVAKSMSVAMHISSRSTLRNPANQSLWLEAMGMIGDGTENGRRKARSLLAQLLEQEPQFHAAYPQLAVLEYDLSDDDLVPLTTTTQRLRDLAHQSLSLAPDNIDGRMALAIVHLHESEQRLTWRESKTLLDEQLGLLRELPNSVMTLGWTSSIAEAMGEHAVAIDYLDRLVMLEPLQAENRLARARSLLALGRLEEAVSEMDVALELEPRSRYAYWNKTILQFQRGRFSDGFAVLESCFEAGADGCQDIAGTALTMLRAHVPPDSLNDKGPRSEKAEVRDLLAQERRRGGYAAMREYIDRIDPEHQSAWIYASEALTQAALGEGLFDVVLELVADLDPDAAESSDAPLMTISLHHALQAGAALHGLGRLEEAKRRFERVLSNYDRTFHRNTLPYFPTEPDIVALAWLGRENEALQRLQFRIDRGWARERDLIESAEGRPDPLAAPLLADERFVSAIAEVRAANARKLAELKADGTLDRVLARIGSRR